MSQEPAFEAWGNRVFDLTNVQPALEHGTLLGDVRKYLTISIFNEAGKLGLGCMVINAWVSELITLSDLDARGTAVVIGTVTLQSDGWQRDPDIKEKTEPAFSG